MATFETTGDSTGHTPITIDPSQNPTSPYYLHPGENPIVVIVSPPLNGSNYHSWSRATKRALLTKNKHKFIDGFLIALAKDDALYDSWNATPWSFHGSTAV